jgi:hypothetical protein
LRGEAEEAKGKASVSLRIEVERGALVYLDVCRRREGQSRRFAQCIRRGEGKRTEHPQHAFLPVPSSPHALEAVALFSLEAVRSVLQFGSSGVEETDEAVGGWKWGRRRIRSRRVKRVAGRGSAPKK